MLCFTNIYTPGQTIVGNVVTLGRVKYEEKVNDIYFKIFRATGCYKVINPIVLCFSTYIYVHRIEERK